MTPEQVARSYTDAELVAARLSAPEDPALVTEVCARFEALVGSDEGSAALIGQLEDKVADLETELHIVREAIKTALDALQDS